MRIIYYNKELEDQVPSVATIGMFDGVHIGHRFVLGKLCEEARRIGLTPTVVTFDRHPLSVVRPDKRQPLITTLDDRLTLLATTGVERCVVLPFDREMAQMTSREFLALLKRQLGVEELMTGYDNHFGHDRDATFDDYVAYGKEMGVTVKCMPEAPRLDDGRTVCSSLVREILSTGNVHQVYQTLHRYYSITGTVVAGEQVGRKIGFPTANLQVGDGTLVPPPAVYAVEVAVDDEKTRHQAMMNIGTRPTFGGHRQTLEVHLFDFDGDLYGRRLRVAFVARLRTEEKFSDIDAMKAQLARDETMARLTLKEATKRNKA